VNAPITILIGALGGEGGGVLSGWLVAAARACGYPVQATSIPGVAQRTGATTYYIEIFPVTHEALGGREVVLALSPVPGQVDLMVCSELLEAARAAANGMISPERTTLIASTHRTYTVAEKASMGDGRFDSARLRAALERFAHRAVLFDMDAAARRAGTVISAVMLGAIAGSGRLPLPRAACEEAIRADGRGAAASLAGFAAGFEAAGGVAPTLPSGDARVPGREPAAAHRVAERVAPAVRPIVAQGYARQIDYQDRAYAERYLERVERVYRAEAASGAELEFPVTEAYARFLALWMSYEDVIRVADLKTRASRRARVRAEAGAEPEDLVRLIEYFKPTVEEWCALLPPRAAARLRAWAGRGNRTRRLFARGMHVRTTSLHGFLMLRALAGLRRWRPRSSRFAEEQALIERWSAAVLEALAREPARAHEIALCGRLIKGYGDTHARGKANFLRILDTLVAAGADAQAIRAAREAALADPEGVALERSLAHHGVAPLPPRAQPIAWHEPRRAASGATGAARAARADGDDAAARAAKH